MIFAGLTDWFEIFKAGKHTDMAGHTKIWTEADLQKIASSYDPATSEAPLVIGHPALDAPAFGWGEQLKVENGILYAKAKDVNPEFEGMVRQGMFKKRSIALNPDLTLRHIGFLGAVPPAVKGLKDISFASDASITIEFADNPWAWNSIASMFRRFREWLIATQDTDTADQIVPEYLIQDIQQVAAPAQEAELYSQREVRVMNEPAKGSPPQQYSEADVERIRNEAKAEGRREVAAEFAETEKTERKKTITARIAAFCETMKKDGRLIPAWEKLGLQQFLESLDHETVIVFAEGDGGKKSQLEFMEAFLAEIPKVVTFSEVASRETAVMGAGSAGEKLTAITRQKMDANKDLSYKAAFAQAQTENPDLAKEYQIEIGGE